MPGALDVPGDLSAQLAEHVAPDLARTVVVYCSGPTCGRSKVTAKVSLLNRVMRCFDIPHHPSSEGIRR
jgi:hypothetical protein